MNLPITPNCTSTSMALYNKLTAGIKIFLMLFLFVGNITPAKLSAQVTAIPGWANVLTPAGGFSIDGDLFANTPTPNQGDWIPL